MRESGTPLTVVGGYLGAGKTTLVNHLLRRADGRRVAVLVNDFGDVDIDGTLIESVADDVVRLVDGCICCSLADGLAEAFAHVHERLDAIDHVVVEASGVADPTTIAQFGRAAGLKVGPLVVVVDAASVQRRAGDRYVGDTVLRQLAAADVCVVNKVDLVDAEHLDRTRAWLTDMAPRAEVVECERCETGWEPFELGTSGGSGTTADGFDHVDAHRARSFEYDAPLDRAQLVRAVAALPDSVVRVKGVVALADDAESAYAVQRSGDEVDVVALDMLPPAISRIVVITAGPTEVPDGLL